MPLAGARVSRRVGEEGSTPDDEVHFEPLAGSCVCVLQGAVAGGSSGGDAGGKRCGRPSMAVVAALLLAFAVLLLLLALGALSLPGAFDGVGGRGAGLARPPRRRPRLRFRRSTFLSGLEMRGENGEPCEPRTFVYHNFLEECDHLISLAKPCMNKSTVVDSSTGGSKDSRFQHCPNSNWDIALSMMIILLDGAICKVQTSS